MAETLFHLRNVSYQYGQSSSPDERVVRAFALRDVSLTIEAGEYIAVVGSNGSGKSTLAKLLTGLLTPSSGEIYLDGRPLAETLEEGTLVRRVGMVFQDPDMQTVASMVEEDVAFSLENLQYPYALMQEQVKRALETVNMWQHRQRDVDSLSGGQRQRVAIAGVLSVSPACVIFDEATSMLDPIGRREIRAQMKALAKDGHAIIHITHQMEEAFEAERVIVLCDGELVRDGSPMEVFRDANYLKRYHLLPPVAALASTILAEHMGRLEFANNGALSLLSASETASCLRQLNPDVAAQIGRMASPSAEETESSFAQESEMAVDIQHLTHVYGQGTPLRRFALSDVSMSVRKGEVVAIVGQTGSGKSTLSLYLNGLYQASKGKVLIFQDDPSELTVRKQVRKRVGMLFQKSEEQIFEMLIGDEVAYAPLRFGMSTEAAREAAKWAMEQVGLRFDLRDQPTHHLSGGERRKVALASVLAQRPDMLVLDEPTMALDPTSRQDLLQLFARLRRDEGMTIVFVTHSLEEVAEIADRVIVLHDGQCVLDTQPRRWLTNATAVETYGFDVPDVARFALAICREFGIGAPPFVPLTAAEFEAWFRLCLTPSDTQQGEGG